LKKLNLLLILLFYTHLLYSCVCVRNLTIQLSGKASLKHKQGRPRCLPSVSEKQKKHKAEALRPCRPKSVGFVQANAPSCKASANIPCLCGQARAHVSRHACPATVSRERAFIGFQTRNASISRRFRI
jgi:hypothetical protein